MFVSANVAGVNPAADAVTLYVPAKLFATGTGDVAMPAESVTAVTEMLPPNVALGPTDGAVKVTVTFATGVADASITFA